MKHIGEIGRQTLCTACGGCALACPVGAITMEENPAGFMVARVDESVCIDCGLCRKVCPSVPENTKQYAPRDLLHGVCLEGFVGYAADEGVRLGGQSGGIVTALLCHLLRSGTVDTALVAGFDEETRRPKGVLADTEEAVLASAGSYYTQLPILPALKQAKGKRVVAVTLGCQNASLKLMEAAAPKWVPEYRIGLICAGQNSGAMIDDIRMSLGGRIAEELIMGDISTGASGDIQQATKVARDMVTRYGMSDKMGTVLYGSEHSSSEVFLGRDYGTGKNYSEETAAQIDAEIQRIIKEAYAKATEILSSHIDKLHFVAQYLLAHESMDGDQFAAAMKDGATVEELEAIAAEKAEKSRRDNEERAAMEAAKREEEEAKSDSDGEDSGDDGDGGSVTEDAGHVDF